MATQGFRIDTRLRAGAGFLLVLMAVIAATAAYDAWNIVHGVQKLQRYNKLVETARKWADNNALNNDRTYNLVVSKSQPELATEAGDVKDRCGERWLAQKDARSRQLRRGRARP